MSKQTLKKRTMLKCISSPSAALVVFASLAPTALAVSALEKNDPPGPISVTDTGVSKVRSGKAVVRPSLPSVRTDRQALRLSLEGFRIEGDPRLMPEALDKILAPWRGRELNFSEYEAAIHAVAQYLRRNGHPNAQVTLSRAIVGQGQVMIAIEGLSSDVPAVAEASVDPKVDIRGFKVTGTDLLGEQLIKELLAEFSGRPLSAQEMENAAQTIANHLRSLGYPFIQAYLPPQRVDSGILEIAVLEGRLDRLAGRDGVIVEGAVNRIRPEVIEDFLAKGAKPGEPLRVADLERAVLLIGDLPGVREADALVEPGSQTGSTQLRLNVKESNLLGLSLWGDNYGNRYTGQDRASGQFLLNSPMGYGEQLSLQFVSSRDSENVRVGGSIPLGAQGFRVGLAYSETSANFGRELRTIDLNSDARVATLNASYALIRSAERNISLSGAYERKHYVTDLVWGRENDRVLNSGTLALNGNFFDRKGGQNKWSFSVSGGDVDLSRQPEYADRDALTAQTSGGYSKLNWQASRSAMLADSKRWSWLLSTSGQYASKNLDSSEKFQLGGPQGIRAYPVSEGIGDHGWILSAELRYQVPEKYFKAAQLFGFADIGGVTQYARTWNDPGTSIPALGIRPNYFMLKGAGLGASFSFGKWGGLNVIWAKKIDSNPNPTFSNTDSDGLNKSSRIWILGNIVF